MVPSPSRQKYPLRLLRSHGVAVEEVGLAAPAAVVAVEVVGHEDAAAALGGGAFFAQARDLPGVVDLVHFQESELDLLVHVGDALGLGVHLLLALLAATAKAQDEVQGGFLLDVVIREGAAVLKLLAREDETLLVGGNAFLVLDLSLDVVDGVRRLHLQGDGLTRDCVWKAGGRVSWSAQGVKRREANRTLDFGVKIGLARERGEDAARV